MTATEVVDALNKASDILHLQCDIKGKKEQIHNTEYTKCGNCNHWMKVTCRTEKEFKMERAASDHACDEFFLSQDSKNIIQVLEKELIDLQNRIAETGKYLHKTFANSAKQKTCGTCKDWNFKCSNVKAWGQCLNPKKRNFCYVSMRGFPDHLKNTDEYHQFQKDVPECCEIYFEENFGCVNHVAEEG